MVLQLGKCLCTSLSMKAGEEYTQKVRDSTVYYGKFAKIRFCFYSPRYHNQTASVTITQTTSGRMVFFDDMTTGKNYTFDNGGRLTMSFFVCSTSEETTSWRKTNVKLTFDFVSLGDIVELMFDVVHFYFDHDGNPVGVTEVDRFHVDTLTTDNGLIEYYDNGADWGRYTESDYINGNVRRLEMKQDEIYVVFRIVSEQDNRYLYFHNSLVNGRVYYFYPSDWDFSKRESLTASNRLNICIKSSHMMLSGNDDCCRDLRFHDVLLLDF